MIDLQDTYRRLARPWTRDELGASYERARRRGAELLDAQRYHEVARPLALLATAIPPSATLNVAIHVIHALPDGPRGSICNELSETAERNAADALGRCHRTLELDAAAHNYAASQWLPVVYDIAGPTPPLTTTSSR